MQRKHWAPARSVSSEVDPGNQKGFRGVIWKKVFKRTGVALGLIVLCTILLQIGSGSRVSQRNAASIAVNIRSIPIAESAQLGRKVTAGRVAGVVDEQLVQAAVVQEVEHKPGVQLLKPLQPVLKSGDGKENGPRVTQDSLGDLRQSAREQAAINSGVAGVGLSAAEAELVAVAGPPPPPPDPYEEAIAEATREKDGMRVAALKEAKEKAAKSWGAMGQRIMDRASKFAHGNLEGRKQLELPIRQSGGAQPRGDHLVQLSQVRVHPAVTAQAALALAQLRAATTISSGATLGLPVGAAQQGLLRGGSAIAPLNSSVGPNFELPSELPAQPLPIDEGAGSDPLSIIRDKLAVDGPYADETARRRAMVKKAMAHSWAGYVRYAWGFDELRPVTMDGENSFCGLGATIVDSLDTLWLMDMKQEFQRGTDWVRDVFQTEKECAVSVFETIIRVVGGMLAAYELSGEPVLLKKCQELTDALLLAFNTPMGFPQTTFSLKYRVATTPSWIGYGTAVLSELGTVQLELMKMSELTGKPEYAQAAEKIIKNIHERHPDEGLLPMYLSTTDASGSGKFSIGAMADSYYEYLLKVWLLKGRAPDAEMYRSMWEKAMDEMRVRLTRTSSTSNLTYVGDSVGFGDQGLSHKMEHLTCFIAGNLALGVDTGAVKGEKAAEYLALARNLTYTCYQMYMRMPTGLSPEYVDIPEGATTLSAGYTPYNILRPEAVESIFMLWRITKDPQYLDWGWDIFQAFEKWSKVSTGGYTGQNDVSQVPPANNNKMESFWLAETLKYLYLLYSPEEVLPLSKWVLNTEAHPLKIETAGVSLGVTAQQDKPAVLN